MRKLLIMFLLVPMVGWAQKRNDKVLDAVTVTKDTAITVEAFYHNVPWAISVLPGITNSTTSRVIVQVSPDGTNWANCPDVVYDTLAQNVLTVFQGGSSPHYYYRLYVDMEANKNMPLSVWFSFKR